MSKLQDALNHHQSTLNQAFTAQDRAVNAILLLLVGEVQALHNEMATLRRDMLLSGSDTAPPAAQESAPNAAGSHETIPTILKDIKDIGHELRILRREIDRLKRLPASARTAFRTGDASAIPYANVAPMHPVEELLDEAALLDTFHGEASTEATLNHYINRQRVRPEDIQLTPEELRRTRKPGLRRTNYLEPAPAAVRVLLHIMFVVMITIILACIFLR